MMSHTMTLLDNRLQNLEARFIHGDINDETLRAELVKLFGVEFAKTAYRHMVSVQKLGG